MLGAQARAAELQAAKSAAMRQKAHREADESVPPPDVAPIPLADFTRNALPNKNKGAKAFRPLIVSDLEGPSDLPTQQNHALEPLHRPNKIRPVTTPVAPRAMLEHSILDHCTSTPPQSLMAEFTPRMPSARSQFRYLGANDSIESPPYFKPGCSARNHVFGPGDLSPTKQEIKFSEMRAKSRIGIPPRAPSYHAILPLSNDEIKMTLRNMQYDLPTHYYDMGQRMALDLPQPGNNSPVRDRQSSVDASTMEHVLNRSQMPHSSLLTSDLNNNNNNNDHQHYLQLQQQQQQQQARLRMQSQSRRQCQGRDPFKSVSSVLDKDRQYNRDSKMQSFVAAQQALARKGKTVLHNPDLHRSCQQPEVTSPNPPVLATGKLLMYEEIATPVKSKISSMLHQPVLGRLTNSADDKLKAREIEMAKAIESNTAWKTSEADWQEQATGCHVPEDERLGLMNGTISDDWCTLRPVTSAERDRMLRITRAIARENSPRRDLYSLSDRGSIVGSKAQDWLRSKQRSISARQLAVKNLVHRYERSVNDRSRSRVLDRNG